jgi:hypothetical protein
MSESIAGDCAVPEITYICRLLQILLLIKVTIVPYFYICKFFMICFIAFVSVVRIIYDTLFHVSH